MPKIRTLTIPYLGIGDITPEDRGSYNFGKGSSTESHSLNDMAPWVAWGNSSKGYGNKGSDMTTCTMRRIVSAYDLFPKGKAAIEVFHKLKLYSTVR